MDNDKLLSFCTKVSDALSSIRKDIYYENIDNVNRSFKISINHHKTGVDYFSYKGKDGKFQISLQNKKLKTSCTGNIDGSSFMFEANKDHFVRKGTFPSKNTVWTTYFQNLLNLE